MLKIDHLTKTYGDFRLDVSMEVKPGMITGLVGRNGAGKSTTFKSVLGLVYPESGSVQVFGTDSGKLQTAEREALGVVLAEVGFSAMLNIRDINRILQSMYDKHDAAFFLKQCARFSLPQNKKLKEFSSGMRAKLKLLVAISHGAKLLVLDEPTLGLDVVMREEMLDLLRDYMVADEERSILISSHIATDLEGLCDDIYLINDGRIVLHEETDVLLSSYAVLKPDEKQYEGLEQTYILQTKKEPFGYSCLTNQKQFYVENYPDLVIEQGGIDDLILYMIGGND